VTVVYKICPASLWRAAECAGVFRGSKADRRDGFIHFSTAAQVVETAAKHFAGQSDLLLVRIDAAKFGDRLKWEPSRAGALFPHLYGDLDLAAVMRVEPLPLGADQRHIFPLLNDYPPGFAERHGRACPGHPRL
jgi:uncharacterized protein (DUF952 family)